jgi:hypothetical protein
MTSMPHGDANIAEADGGGEKVGYPYDPRHASSGVR